MVITDLQNLSCAAKILDFRIFKVSRLVTVHTDSHHNGYNKMIFAVSYV